MLDKSTVLKGFNTHFFSFIDDIISIIPENSSIKEARTFFEITKKANATVLIKMWYSNVYSPYASVIDNGDISFFFDKNYEEDVSYIQNSSEILKAIDTIREPFRNLSEDNKEKCKEYIQILCKLSTLYSSL